MKMLAATNEKCECLLTELFINSQSNDDDFECTIYSSISAPSFV